MLITLLENVDVDFDVTPYPHNKWQDGFLSAVSNQLDGVLPFDDFYITKLTGLGNIIEVGLERYLSSPHAITWFFCVRSTNNGKVVFDLHIDNFAQ